MTSAIFLTVDTLGVFMILIQSLPTHLSLIGELQNRVPANTKFLQQEAKLTFPDM